MSRLRIASVLLAAVWLWDAPTSRAGGDENPKAQEAAPSAAPGKLVVTVGKSLIIDSPMKIQRISVANGDLIEAVAVNPKEVLINGKAAGETSLIIWQEGGNRLLYDLTVRLSPHAPRRGAPATGARFPQRGYQRHVRKRNRLRARHRKGRDRRRSRDGDHRLARQDPSTCCASRFLRWRNRSC